MGAIPPPLPPTQAEFEARWAQGARTLKELDPALWEWAERGRRFRMWGWTMIGASLALLLPLLLYALWSGG